MAKAMPDSSSTSSLKSYFLDVRPSIAILPNHLGLTSRTVAQKLFDDKERSHQLYKDEVYSLEDWKKAKSWHRHLPQLDGLELLHGYAWVVFYCFVIAMLVCSYHYWIEPLGAPGWADNDSDVWQIDSDEVLLDSKALLGTFNPESCMQAISWFPDRDEALLLMFARWSIVMSYSLKSNLRGENPVPELQRILPESELEWASKANHLPNTTAQILSNILTAVEMPQFQRVTIDQNINRYLDILGSCERILKTPIHRNWTSHTTRFTLVWLTFFPFALWPVYGWATPFIEIVVAWLLLGIENIGVQIEEPFAVLALDAYCNVCERSVQELMSQRKAYTFSSGQAQALEANNSSQEE